MRKVLGEASDFPTLVDGDGHVSSAYGVDVLPTVVIIDAEGRIAKTVSGTTTEADLARMVAGLSQSICMVRGGN